MRTSEIGLVLAIVESSVSCHVWIEVMLAEEGLDVGGNLLKVHANHGCCGCPSTQTLRRR